MTVMKELPESVTSPAQGRLYFDARKRGNVRPVTASPDKLTAAEKRLVLEYLKTL